MKKQRSFLIIKIVLLTAVIGGLLYAMNAGAARLNRGQEAESMKQLENSIRKATNDLLCDRRRISAYP